VPRFPSGSDDAPVVHLCRDLLQTGNTGGPDVIYDWPEVFCKPRSIAQSFEVGGCIRWTAQSTDEVITISCLLFFSMIIIIGIISFAKKFRAKQPQENDPKGRDGLSNQPDDTTGMFANGIRPNRQMLDAIIQEIMNGRCDVALSMCKSFGLCGGCGETVGPDDHCLPVKLLEASLTSHRDTAFEAYTRLKAYIEESCANYKIVKPVSA
jgi:hypothetical protein